MGELAGFGQEPGEIPLVVTPSPVRVKQMGVPRRTIDGNRTSAHFALWRNETTDGWPGEMAVRERRERARKVGFYIGPVGQAQRWQLALKLSAGREPPVTILTDRSGRTYGLLISGRATSAPFPKRSLAHIPISIRTALYPSCTPHITPCYWPVSSLHCS